jgi:hypothetical protein
MAILVALNRVAAWMTRELQPRHLNPDELVWNYMKRTGAAKRPLAKGESLHDRIDADLLEIQREFSSRLLVLLKMHHRDVPQSKA